MECFSVDIRFYVFYSKSVLEREPRQCHFVISLFFSLSYSKEGTRDSLELQIALGQTGELLPPPPPPFHHPPSKLLLRSRLLPASSPVGGGGGWPTPSQLAPAGLQDPGERPRRLLRPMAAFPSAPHFTQFMQQFQPQVPRTSQLPGEEGPACGTSQLCPTS